MMFISLSLAFSAFILFVNGSDVYLHTGEPESNLSAEFADHTAEAGCLPGKRANVNYNDYSPPFPINLKGCWKDEVESNVDSGARRRSIWVAPPKEAKWGDGLYHCLHKYPANNTANVCESDKIVTATLMQDGKQPWSDTFRC
jgi:hypothetical protein